MQNWKTHNARNATYPIMLLEYAIV